MSLLDLQRPTRREKEEYCYYVPVLLPRWSEFQKKTNSGEQITFLPSFGKGILPGRCEGGVCTVQCVHARVCT